MFIVYLDILCMEYLYKSIFFYLHQIISSYIDLWGLIISSVNESCVEGK